MVVIDDGEIGLRLIRNNKRGHISSGFVPIEYYMIIRLRDGITVGQCDLRVGNNEAINYAGHIGYSVMPPYQGHHYAAKACKLLMVLAKARGLEEILITCNPDNMASRRTCEIIGAYFLGIVQVPSYAVDYSLGNYEKCQYRVLCKREPL